MRQHGVWFGLAMLALVAIPVLARGETAEEAFAQGQARLAEGDFSGALEAYGKAVRANRENQEYLQQYALVRRIVQIREQLEVEQDPARWEYLAQALHSFYASQRLYDELLALNRKVHARLNSAASAVTLAETLLAMGRSAEAAEVLSPLEPGRATPASQALLGVALARQGKVDEARALAQSVALPSSASPGVVYTFARLQALTGDKPGALASLTRCFESLPPSRQEGFKVHARLCPDFADLRQGAEFAQVLATESKIPESACSGGSSCAGCPMRGKCSQGQGR